MHLKNLVYLVHVDSTNSPPSPLVDLRGLFMNPPSPLSGPHGLRMTPKFGQDWTENKTKKFITRRKSSKDPFLKKCCL